MFPKLTIKDILRYGIVIFINFAYVYILLCVHPTGLVLLLRYIWEWSRQDGGYTKVKSMGIATSKDTINRLNKKLHELAQQSLTELGLNNLGGQGCDIEIDESVFVKRKVSEAYATLEAFNINT